VVEDEKAVEVMMSIVEGRAGANGDGGLGEVHAYGCCGEERYGGTCLMGRVCA